MTNPLKPPRPARRERLPLPLREEREKPEDGDKKPRLRERPLERAPAGGGYRILRRPRMLEEE